MASPDLSSKYKRHLRALPNAYDRPRGVDRQVAYIGEGLIDPTGLDTLDQIGEIDIDDEDPDHRRMLLDELAIDVGEKYLDDIYKEDKSEDEGEPQAEAIRYHVHPPIASPSVGLQLKARTKRELAWMKVRQLLIEEEEKTSTPRKPTRRPGIPEDSCSDASDDSCNTVMLLDAMAQSTLQQSSFVNAEYSGRPPTPRKPQQGASNTANRVAQFLQAGRSSDDDTSSTKSSCSTDMPSRWTLTATLEHVTKTCQRMELSDTALARVASHLAAIDQIVNTDVSSRLSSTQVSNDSSGYETHSGVDTLADYPRTGVTTTARSSFKAFVAAEDVTETMAAYSNLLASCGLHGVKINEPWQLYNHIRDAVYSKLGFRQKQLFKLINTRFNLYKQRPAANKRVCIVGAGPVGLRAAVELALLGSEVSVLEKRTKFNRENMLHLWPWVVQDLASLGAKVLHSRFCKSRTYFHVSTRQVQVILLKVALLVGVKIHFATSFQAIIAPEEARAGSRPFYSIRTEPQIPVVEFTAVLGATGVNDQLAEPAAINRFVFSQKESLGIVCYFPNLETTEEMKVKEFSWTTQLKHQMLNKLRDVGIDLDNIVYFRGEMHYLVMTPKRENLLVHRVVYKNYPDPKDLVRKENVDQDALRIFVKSIVRFAGIPRRTDFASVNLFDFSSLTRADKAASILTSHGKKLYVGLIGDSLLEPVWHEGVGTCRGFLGALDGVWMVAQIGKKTDEQLLADRELTYKIMRRVSGHHREELQKNVRKYMVDPRSRYKVGSS
jgi:hypothetical protein